MSQGYPIITHYTEKKQTTQGGFNLGGTNASGQVPELPGNYGLIDKDTPKDAYTLPSYVDGEDLVLVFSDEFNRDGRTFYPGDDPFWEAVDLHYWGTVGSEITRFDMPLIQSYRKIWNGMTQCKVDLSFHTKTISSHIPYHVMVPATTKGGNLELRMDLTPDRANNHNMLYKSGMVCGFLPYVFLQSDESQIQTWNKFCFTGGLLISTYIQTLLSYLKLSKTPANVQLPGSGDVRYDLST